MPRPPMLFTAEWRDVCFIHFALPPTDLQAYVPFPLDLHEGHAWVSLVLFVQHGLRLRYGEETTAWLTAPIATHEFCNLRTYVRGPQGDGIYFMKEWIPNAIAALLGPKTFGLPYTRGDLQLSHEPVVGHAGGRVTTAETALCYEALCTPCYEAARQPLDEFLVERYTAYCTGRGRRCFHVLHEPWPIAEATVQLADRRLIEQACPALRDCPVARTHISPGVSKVMIGLPQGAAPRRPLTAIVDVGLVRT